MRRADRRSDCPVNFALELFGDTWTLLIVRDLMFRDKHTYTEFLQSAEGISTNILADRLRRLVAGEILVREGRGRQASYRLTPKGIDLVRVMVALIEWGGTHDPATAVPPALLARIRRNRERTIAEIRGNLETRTSNRNWQGR